MLPNAISNLIRKTEKKIEKCQTHEMDVILSEEINCVLLNHCENEIIIGKNCQ